MIYGYQEMTESKEEHCGRLPYRYVIAPWQQAMQVAALCHYALLVSGPEGREDYNEEHPQRTELPLAAAQLRLLDHLIAFD